MYECYSPRLCVPTRWNPGTAISENPKFLRITAMGTADCGTVRTHHMHALRYCAPYLYTGAYIYRYRYM